ncbi:MAG TPA: PDZ domain-containing protein [Clostridiales bacterium]|nr:PDZ domain-containing protein [Clostridiales bacterium]
MAGFIKLLFTAFAQSITSFLYILITAIVYMHIKNEARLEETWLGFLRETVKNRLMNAMLYGMIAGLAASTLIVATGIPIDLNTAIILWPFALMLTLINKRFICFSYAGGIISLISLVSGWPKIDVPAVIAFIGILHLTESILILLDGHRDALPVVMEHKRFKPIGAFVMNRLWPVPLIILTIPTQVLPASGGGVAMPDWWPVFSMQNEGGFMLFPLALAIEYGGLAVTAVPRERTRLIGLSLGIYSLFIFALAYLSIRFSWLQYAAAVLMPSLHELIMYFSKKSQMEGKPILGAPWRGLRILDVLPDTIGSMMGLKPGDVLLNINGKAVNSEEMLVEALNNAPLYLWMDISRRGNAMTVEYRNYNRNKDKLGVIFVPRKASHFYIPDERHGLAFLMMKRLTQRKHLKM